MAKTIKFKGMEIEGDEKTFILEFEGGQAAHTRATQKAKQRIRVCPRHNMIQGVVNDAWYIRLEELAEIYETVKKIVEAERIITNTEKIRAG